jgi:hypothetical protein
VKPRSLVGLAGIDALGPEQKKLKAFEERAASFVARYDRVPNRPTGWITRALDGRSAVANRGEARRATGRRRRTQRDIGGRTLQDRSAEEKTATERFSGTA